MAFDPKDQERIRRVFDAVVGDVADVGADPMRARASMERRRSPVATVALGLAIGLAVAVGVGALVLRSPAGGDVAASSTSVTTTGPATTTVPMVTTIATTFAPTTLPAGCSSGAVPVPAGATSRVVGDLDGDGRADTAWIVAGPDGVTRVGVATAAGGGAVKVWDSASPVMRSILVADADAAAPFEIFADDGRLVQLWQFRDCQILDVLNAQGRPYVFSLGFGVVGTGVGCVDIAGSQELVGLDVTADDGTTVSWSRTIVHLEDGHAVNGEISTGTFTRPGDSAAIDLLHTVSCGTLTMADDGITATAP
jgi:hypothetical protein